MSGQLIELLVFAVVAIILCNKLISLVGKVSDKTNDEQSFFGDSNVVKDVTYKEVDKEYEYPKNSVESIYNNIVDENRTTVMKNLYSLKEAIPDFNISNFLQGSKKAFKMILEERFSGDDVLINLVDKRYIKNFKDLKSNYEGIQIKNMKNLSAKISEICIFGNNIFIKVIFSGYDFFEEKKNFEEEWTFSKNNLVSGKNWFLSNVD